ncbi:MAG: tol-pal system-associated acyl-CoA thioesterase [Alphaproteobacteria bacterium]|nr:tol-pal system-associated acyl-CoA thioesterase [Alphaproteobacteria bacterium]
MSEAFSFPIRVYYEDTDVGGVVYYANYLRFMERSRTEFLRALGFEQDDLIEREGILFAVVHADIAFHKPARFNDLLQVSVEIEASTRTTVRFLQHVRREGAEEKPLCTGRIRAACLDAKTYYPRAIPQRIAEAAL